MTAPTQTPPAFEAYLKERLQEPAVRAGYEDKSAVQHLLDRLVGFRKHLKLSQLEVARRMGVGQPSVSGFETEQSDPRVATVQRYARAVEARVEFRISWEAGCDWLIEESAYESPVVSAPRVARQTPRTTRVGWAAPYTLAA